MTELRHATHNQGDRAVSPSSGWDVQCLTERSKHGPPHWAERHSSRLLKGLAIDWNPDVLDVRRKGSALAHVGLAGFSPNRGTLWVTGRLVESGVKVAVVCSHRLNDPDGNQRSYGPVRRLLWKTHAALDARLFKRLEKQGHLVFYGGDINDRRADLNPLERLLVGHYDALGHTDTRQIRLVGNIRRDRTTSDHSRFTATYAIKENCS